ncbi:hypothetical protein Tco_1393456 [Tanacetum coccineum]
MNAVYTYHTNLIVLIVIVSHVVCVELSILATTLKQARKIYIELGSIYFDDETHVAGSMVESSRIKKEKKFDFVRKEELVDLLGPEVGPITLKVYREDGTSEVIPNFKASDLHLDEWREVMNACLNRTVGQKKLEAQWTADERKAANLDQRFKGLIMSVLPDDQMNSVINCLTAKSTWDDLILYHEGPSDVKESHFARDCWSKTSVPSYRPPFQSKLLLSSENKPEPRQTKDFEAKYHKVKAKLALLSSSASTLSSSSSKNKGLIAETYDWDDEEVSSDENEVTGVRALMALTDEERVSHVNTEILKENQSLRLELKELTSNTETWLNSSNKVNQSDNSDMSITSSNTPKSSETKDSTIPNQDIDEVPLNESQRNTTDPSVVVSDFSATDYDSANEFLVCITHLLSLKKLDGAKPVSRPKTIKSILKSKSTFKAETLKGVTINKPSSAPARGRSSSASKTNSAPPDKLKNVKMEDDPPLAIDYLSKKRNQSWEPFVIKSCKTCGSNVHTTSDHNDIEWFRKRETLQAKNAESFKASKNESSSALRSKTPTKRVNSSTMSAKLDKTLYGLKLVSKAWYETLSTYLAKSSPSQKVCKQFEKLMTRGYEISMIGVLTYFLKSQIKKSERGISINKEKNVNDLLRMYDKIGSSVNTLIMPPNMLGPNLNSKAVNEAQYRGMIGPLMNLTTSRPNIQFSTTYARHQANIRNPTLPLLRIFRYINGTSSLGLQYPKSSGLDLKGQ